MNVSFNQRFLRYVLYPFLKVFVVRVGGYHNIPPDGAYIIASNHVSLADPFLLASIPKPYIKNIIGMRFIVACLYYDKLILRLLLKPLGAVRAAPVLWSYESYFAEIRSSLDRGHPALIFVEGRRSPEPSRAKPGVGFLAANSKLPIVPLKIQRHSLLRFSLTFGKPKRYSNKSYQQIADTIYDSIWRV